MTKYDELITTQFILRGHFNVMTAAYSFWHFTSTLICFFVDIKSNRKKEGELQTVLCHRRFIREDHPHGVSAQ